MRLQTLSKLAFSCFIACIAATPLAYGQGGSVGGIGQAGIDIDAAGVLRVSHVDPSIAFTQRMATLQSQPR
ncbi:MAG: hypothetical protein ACOVQM_21480, partial [Pirellula sp.]